MITKHLARRFLFSLPIAIGLTACAPSEMDVGFVKMHHLEGDLEEGIDLNPGAGGEVIEPNVPPPVGEPSPEPSPEPSSEPSPEPSVVPGTNGNRKDKDGPKPKASPSPQKPSSEPPSPKPNENPGPAADEPQIPEQYLCGEGRAKVLVCHHSEAFGTVQTLCLSRRGATLGHQVPLDGSMGVSGDYLGPCPAD